MRKSAFAVAIAITFCATSAFAGRHERREAAVAESGKAQSVTGGIDFQVGASYESVYDGALNYLKRTGYMIESADKDAGQIVTEMVVSKGGFGKQKGTRVYVVLMKDNATSTTVRVTVTEQKRAKLLQTEPWNEPKVDTDESQRLTDELKTKLLTASAAN